MAEAEARGALERHSALSDGHAELRAKLRREEELVEARQRELAHDEVHEPAKAKQLDEAKEKAVLLTASLRGREERHAMLLETLGALRHSLAERESRVHELTER